jgi:two-component system phosphate regulon sensor histidine kinase PhoR
MSSWLSHPEIRSSNDSKGKAFLVIAVVCSIAFLSAWATGLIAQPPSNWPLRYRFLGLSFTLGMACTYLWARRVALQQMAAQRYFKALCQVDPVKFAQGTLASDLPSLPQSNPCSESARRFTEFFRTHCERVEQVEHIRTATEVRMKRTASRLLQLETVLSGLSEAVIAVDQNDQVVLINPAAEHLLGIDLQATGNREISHILHSQALVELLTETRRRKPPSYRAAEVELLDEAGQSRTYGVTVRSFTTRNAQQDDDVPATGVFAVLRDTSLLKASQKRNADFVSAVSHEMKTPLAGIKAYVELLVDGDAKDEQTREEFLNVINSQANRLQRLIDNPLNLARIEAGVVRVSKEATSLNELLLEAANIVRPAAEAKQINLTADLSQMFIGVLVDRDMMMQTAINLLSNAVKYTNYGGCVTLRSRLADQEAIFEVHDNGVGLSDDDKQRVFEMFYRVKKDREMAPGTGLGLPLAKHIVEDVHGGRLIVASELGQGSTFSVALPVVSQMACHT